MSNPLDELLGADTRPKTGKHGTPTRLLDNLEMVESGGNNPRAVNKESGATGSYQFMPNTVKMLQAKGIKFDPTSQSESRDAADQYIQMLAKQHGGDYRKAMAAYGGFIKQDPTAYVGKVMANVEEPNPLEAALGPYSGAGRGGQGGPTAAQNAERVYAPAVKQSKSVQGESIQSKGFAGTGTLLKEIGRSVTSNLVDYPAAGVYSVVNDTPYKESLARVREINKADAAAHPTAALVGGLTGDIIQGTGLAGVKALGAGTKLGQAVLGSSSSAVSTLAGSEEANLTDAGKAALLTGGIHAASALAKAGGDKVVNRYVNKEVAKINKATTEKIDKFNKSIPATTAEINAQKAAAKAEADAANKAAQRQWVESIPESGAVPPRPQMVQPKPTRDIPEAINPKDVHYVTPEDYRLAKSMGMPSPSIKNINDPTQSATKAAWEGVKDTTKDIAKTTLTQGIPASIGAGAVYAMTNDDASWSPLERAMAVGGAAVGGWKTAAGGRAATEFALRHPQQVDRFGKAIIQSTGKVFGENAVPDNRSKIQRTIDDYDERQAARRNPPQQQTQQQAQSVEVNPLDELLKD